MRQPLETKPILQKIQTSERHFIREFDYQSYPLAHHSTRYKELVLSIIAKTVKNIMSRKKAYSFGLSNFVFTISFSATSELACDTNYIHKGAAMCVIHFFVEKSVGIDPEQLHFSSCQHYFCRRPVHLTELLKQKKILSPIWNGRPLLFYNVCYQPSYRQNKPHRFVLYPYSQHEVDAACYWPYTPCRVKLKTFWTSLYKTTFKPKKSQFCYLSQRRGVMGSDLQANPANITFAAQLFPGA